MMQMACYKLHNIFIDQDDFVGKVVWNNQYCRTMFMFYKYTKYGMFYVIGFVLF